MWRWNRVPGSTVPSPPTVKFFFFFARHDQLLVSSIWRVIPRHNGISITGDDSTMASPEKVVDILVKISASLSRYKI